MRSILLCHLRRRFCHLLVVIAVAVVVVIFVIVIVIVALAAVSRAGARARGEQRQQQQQQCRALGVRMIPPGTIEMILHTEEEERLLREAVVECGTMVGVRGDYCFLRSVSRPEDGGVVPHLARCFCLRGGWGGRWHAGRRWRRWGRSSGPKDTGGGPGCGILHGQQ